MSVDFAVFDLTELAVLDANDAVALPAMGASIAPDYVEDMDELIGDGADIAAGCSSSTCSSCC
ncbi:hypothetical protein [Streptacidiphilus sp. EB129]|jgi:hypothetical protein|uniref:hypothetical protein n=1 Tax=Streptacidiphilus sp. EB129 TaxID=3156262 RepID=UPI003510DA98